MAESLEIRLPVPLFRQRFIVEQWTADGFASPEESAYWSDRSCGVACVQMCLAYFRLPVPPLHQLLKDGQAVGAFGPRGWIHNKLGELAKRYGLPGKAQPGDLASITDELKLGNPIIASVTERLPSDGRKGGHLIVITGVQTRSAEPSVIYFNDPSRWGQTHSEVPAKRFLDSFSGRVIIWVHARGEK